MKTKIYVITSPFTIEFGKEPTVMVVDPRELTSCPSDLIFIEEYFVNLPDGYTIEETKMYETRLFKGNVVCDLSVSGHGILVDSSTADYKDTIRLEFV